MRELKRLENIARSPLYSHFNETLTGLSTIRAFKSSKMFIQSYHDLNDFANRPTNMKNTVDSWMSIRAEAFIAILIFGVAVVGIATKIPAALLGLALSYALTLTALLNMGLRNVCFFSPLF
jgi:ABC-type multidrug transport system fused ATPase/permease subunit